MKEGMRIFYTPKFERDYKKLSSSLKIKIQEEIEIFKKDPFHPSLKTHKLSWPLQGLWSFSVTYSHRVIFQFSENEKEIVYFHGVGDHSIYN